MSWKHPHGVNIAKKYWLKKMRSETENIQSLTKKSVLPKHF